LLNIRTASAMLSFAISFFVVAVVRFGRSKKLDHNVNYNGPFNTNDGTAAEPRRLQLLSSSATDVSFYHGVASGDATSSEVLIWTRVTPPFQNEWALDKDEEFNSTQLSSLKTEYETVTVEWAISNSEDALDFECTGDVYCGATTTSVDIDYTVKVIVDSLAENEWYYYQFKVGDTLSDIGRTRTIPSAEADIDLWSFAFGSCKQYAHGYFTNLGDIAANEDLDMLVWLGDYIYEFPNDPLVNGSGIGREPYPDVFLYTLEQYRQRYLSHHLDENVQAAHMRLPWYIVWDDHEVVNDYWFDGAPDQWQDDTLFGVDFLTRKQNGFQAFFEWLPVRSLDVTARGGLYRSFAFGNLFDLIMIDARSQRTQPAENVTFGATLSADEHYAFGETQREWILSELQASQSRGSKWRIFGSDDVFGQSPPDDVFNGRTFFGEDKLEGYDAERQHILDYIADNAINNVVSLAGGPHTGIAQYVFSTGQPLLDDSTSVPLITEFVLDAMSAPKLFETDRFSPYVDVYAEEWAWVSPYFRLEVDGYCIMRLGKDGIAVEYWINHDTRSLTTRSVLDKLLCVPDGSVQFLTDNCPSIVGSPVTTEEDDSFITTETADSGDTAVALANASLWCFVLLFVVVTQ